MIGATVPSETLQGNDSVSGAVNPAKTFSPAQDPDTPAETLLSLLDKDEATNRLLARHLNAGADLLEKLARSSDKATRRAVAANPCTPPETLVRLGQQFPREFLANPVLDLLLLVNPALMEEVPEQTLIRLLKRAECPSSLLFWASAHPRPGVQLAVAMNVNAPENALERLRVNPYREILETLEARQVVDFPEGPEQAFEQAVRDRLGSLDFDELFIAWKSGDIGLAQWSALPLMFRLCFAAQRFHLPAEIIARILLNTTWSIESLRSLLPRYPGWNELARDPSTPPSVLAALATDPDPRVRSSLAENPSTPVGLLEALAKDKGRHLRCLAARNPATPLSALEALTKDVESTVRSGVAGNSGASMSVLEALARDSEAEVRLAIAGNPVAPREALEMLARDSEVRIRLAIAGNPGAPMAALEIFAKDPDRDIRYRVAGNPGAPRESLEMLSKDSETKVRLAIAGNPGTPMSALEIFAKDPDRDIRQRVADNPGTPMAVLKTLAKDPDEGVRRELALRCTTPGVLETLAEDIDEGVRRAVVGNSAAPVQVLAGLSKDSASSVRCKVAAHSATPGPVLETLAQDSVAKVRVAVAKNAAAPPGVLERLAATDNIETAIALTENPNTPLPTLVGLVKSRSVNVRAALAIHAHRSETLCRALWHDSNPKIRAWVVFRNDQLNSEMLDEMARSAESETEFLELLMKANLSPMSTSYLADKLFATTATDSPWYLRELSKAPPEVLDAARAGRVLSQFGKDPNKSALAKRALAPLMALFAGPYLEPSRIVKLAGSSDWLIRAAVAHYSWTPPNLLSKLAKDATPIVARLARIQQDKAVALRDAKQTTPSEAGNDDGRVITEIVDRLTKGGADGASNLIRLATDDVWSEQASVADLLSGLGIRLVANLPSLVARLGTAERDLMFELGAKATDLNVRKILAEDPACSAHVLGLLAIDAEVDVLLAALTNPVLPEAERGSLVRRLAKFRGKKLLGLLRDVRVPSELLQLKALSRDAQVRAAVAGNVATPVPVLEALAEDPSRGVRKALAGNPSAPATVLEELAKEKALRGWGAVASNPAAPVTVLEVLASDPDPYVRREVAGNRSAPEAMLEVLAGDPDPSVRREVAGNRSAPEAVLQGLAGVSDPRVRTAVARNRSAPEAVLGVLANDADPDVRRWTAMNPSSPQKFRRLHPDEWKREWAGGIHWVLRNSVARNPSVPVEVLEGLAGYPDPDIRRAVAGNPSTPEAVLGVLANDSDPDVWLLSVLHPSSPSEIRNLHLEEWAQRIKRAIRRECCIREGKTPEPQVVVGASDVVRALDWLGLISVDADNRALTKASRSMDWLTRLGAAAHPSATKGILTLLRRDSDPDVARVAASR